MCALELEREGDVERYGNWPFEIGLWVGRAATPNRMGRKGDDEGMARSRVRRFKVQGQPARKSFSHTARGVAAVRDPV